MRCLSNFDHYVIKSNNFICSMCSKLLKQLLTTCPCKWRIFLLICKSRYSSSYYLFFLLLRNWGGILTVNWCMVYAFEECRILLKILLMHLEQILRFLLALMSRYKFHWLVSWAMKHEYSINEVILYSIHVQNSSSTWHFITQTLRVCLVWHLGSLKVNLDF